MSTNTVSEEIKLIASRGEISFPKGLEGVIVAESTKSYVDGIGGKLYYHGIPIEQLADKSTFEEVFYLLMYDHLPSVTELSEFKGLLTQYREIPDAVYTMIQERGNRYNAQPMALLRTAVSSLACWDESAEEDSPIAHQREAIKITSKLSTLVAAIGQASRGLPAVHPRADLPHAANFLWMLTGQEPDPYLAHVLDVILILHADHESNASTFAVTVVKSTLADMYSAIVAGIGTLKGPLHGGANEEVMKMLKEIGEPEQAEAWVMNAVAQKKKVPGFGHRVYKTMDPRATILRQYAGEITRRAGTEKYLRMAEIIERTMVDKLGQKGIYPNVDFFSGIVLSSMGIDTPLFTPIFAVSRVAGWVAHAWEQRQNNRLYRPRFVYVGPDHAEYVPVGERKPRP